MKNQFSSPILSLDGQFIDQWFGVEMAFSETEDPKQNPLVWKDPSIPFQQFFEIGVMIGGNWHVFYTEQNDDEWGLGIFNREPIIDMDEGKEDGIYRNSELTELPTGRIEEVELEFSDVGNIRAISFDLSSARVKLIAGEVYEDSIGSFSVKFMDESVLMQTEFPEKTVI